MTTKTIEQGEWQDAYSVALYQAGVLVSVNRGSHAFHPYQFPVGEYIVSGRKLIDFLKSLGVPVKHPHERNPDLGLREADANDMSFGYYLRNHIDWSHDVAIDRLRVRIDGPGMLSLRILLKYRDGAMDQGYYEENEIMYSGSFSIQWRAETKAAD